MIEEAFVKHLTDNKIEHTVNKNKYKIKFKLYVTDKFNEKVTESIEAVMRILHVKDKGMCCVEFTRLSGRLSTFLAHYESYKQDVLKFADDSKQELIIGDAE